MHITELEINNYGKFNEKKINLTSGINVIYGENESGKSTIFSFIKSMFFGVERQRGAASKNDEYSVYEPWMNRTYYEGKLRFVAGERQFRIERGFNKANKYACLYNEEDGEELDIEQGDLKNILDGMTENIFISANALAQNNTKGIAGLRSEFRNYTSNCGNIYDNPINVDGAIDNLKSIKKEYEGKLREEKAKRLQFTAKLEGEYKFLQDDIQKKKQQLEENISRLKRKKSELLIKCKNKPAAGVKDLISISAILIVMLVVGVIVGKPLILGGVGLLLGAVRIIYNIINKKIMVNNIEKMYDDDAEIQYLRNSVKMLKADINERAFEADSIRNEIEGFAKENKTELQMAMEIEAVECAIEKIKESVLMIQKDTEDILNRNVSEIYSRITNGKYSNVKVDEEFNVFLNTKDKLISGSRISKGARDELDFAIRLAVSDMFFTEEKMPVIIDDMFAMYDDKRVASAIEVLSEMNTQVIIFTCHKRERKILESKGIIHNYIELTE